MSVAKEPLKVLSSSGVPGTRFISVYSFRTQQRPLFANQHILNFEVMAVRDIELRSRLSKNVHLLVIFNFSHLRSLSSRKRACVSDFGSVQKISKLDSQSKFQMFTLFTGCIILRRTFRQISQLMDNAHILNLGNSLL